MHFCTSFIHEYMSPVFQGTHEVSENTTLSLFLHTQISKNGAATDLIQIDPFEHFSDVRTEKLTYQGNERLRWHGNSMVTRRS